MASFRTSLVVALGLVIAGGVVSGQIGPSQAELNGAAANTRDWLLSNHDYSGQRFVDLKIINRANVRSLRPVCIYQTGYTGPFPVHPVVYRGAMYLSAGPATIAIDATTCQRRWRHEWTPKAKQNFPMHRGVALKEGKVVRGTVDAYLIALDAATGKVLWETPAGDPEKGESFTMPPLLFDDLVIIGAAGSERGVRGWVGAFRLADGSPVWRFNTVPEPGEPGSETWSDISNALVGGGATWTPFTLDVAKGLVFVAVANPAPDFFGEIRRGDNLYTSSVVVLDARTGKLQWYYQVVPHDLHDWDLTHASPLISTIVNGARRDIVAAVGKDGLLHAIDRDTHQKLWDVPVTRRENAAAPVTVAGVRACPGVLGGVEWNGPAYHPQLNMLYTPAVDWCGTFSRAQEFAAGQGYMGGRYKGDPYDDARGLITAVDAGSGTLRWTYNSPQPLLAAITTTSAGLLFTGELAGDFLVLDAQNGAELFRFETGAPNNGGVVTYAIDGRQYVALMSGDTSSLWPTPPAAGNVIIFGLP